MRGSWSDGRGRTVTIPCSSGSFVRNGHVGYGRAGLAGGEPSPSPVPRREWIAGLSGTQPAP